MRSVIWVAERDGFRWGIARGRIARALAAGHITGREAGELHKLAAWLWREENFR
jgi:hypothetical protein